MENVWAFKKPSQVSSEIYKTLYPHAQESGLDPLAVGDLYRVHNDAVLNARDTQMQQQQGQSGIAKMLASLGLEPPDAKKGVSAIGAALSGVKDNAPKIPGPPSPVVLGTAGRPDLSPMLDMYKNSLGALLSQRGGK